MSHKSIKLAAAIVNRGAGNRAAAIFHTYNHEILLAVRGHGTARKAGCQGGTLIKAREIGSDGGKKLFGMTLSQEKAILLILTPTSLRAPILKSICETVMKETGEHAVAISLPVDAVEGLTG